jgi:hypothetical protein
MADINDCVPGRHAKVLRSGVARVQGKVGVIVEVSRVRRPPTAPLRDRVTIDVPGHGEVSVPPADLEVVADREGMSPRTGR